MRLFIIALLAFISTSLIAQSNASQVLISLRSDVDANKLLGQHPELVAQTGLKVERKISRTMNIWLLSHNEGVEQNDVVTALYRLPEVSMAQVNHLLQKRSGSSAQDTLVPNDTYFDDQWQYHNTGSNGGVAGADISAELAWYITTGGLTANGDTIVVAIVDDGMDTTLADLAPNWWRNYNEVPNNNIDDDGNGFIDDYRGWNADEGDDNIFEAGGWWSPVGGMHGSSVAGIVGAKGNDGYGVTGVNWDVKLMIVAGGGDEAQAIAAYDYVLQNRLLYNATGGAKGAYVVATNSSWGMDGLFYTDAPLWCAFYDSLGKAGIISAGATANDNLNIEVSGDMPTSCPSDYLIAVTNTNNTDEKELYAGYGTVSIDLGAPGEGAYTVDAFSGGFAGFGGTSGATPHVAGAIALLHSVPNQEFADYAAANPDSAGIWIKRFIMEGADSNASLQNITVTGGRLNLFGAIEKMYEYFPDEPEDTTTQTGMDDIAWTNSVQVYPNPAVNEVVVQMQNADVSSINLISLEGKIISEHIGNIAARFHHVSLEGMAEGVYILRIENSKGAVVFKKLVKN